jgi:hypothetical protein
VQYADGTRGMLRICGVRMQVDTASGTEAVWWKRNLPFCGFRDYVFGRRVWREGDAYYTVTKGAEHDARPRGANPRVLRVDPYLSAWLIRPVPGRDQCAATTSSEASTAVETVLVRALPALSHTHWAFSGRCEACEYPHSTRLSSPVCESAFLRRELSSEHTHIYNRQPRVPAPPPARSS